MAFELLILFVMNRRVIIAGGTGLPLLIDFIYNEHGINIYIVKVNVSMKLNNGLLFFILLILGLLGGLLYWFVLAGN